MELSDERITEIKKMLDNTTILFLPLWMKRIRENFNDIISGKDLQQIPRDPEDSAVIIGGGPSIEKFNLIERLKARGYAGCVIATDKSLTACLKAGVVPNFICSCDADYREHYIERLFDWDLLEEYYSRIKAVFGVVSPSNVVKKWKGEKFWFVPVLDTAKHPLSVTQVIHHLTMKTVVDVLANVTGLCTVLALYLGKNPIAYMGLDLSFPGAKSPEETEYWPDWTGDVRRDIAFRKVRSEINGEECWTELRLETFHNLLVNVLSTFNPKKEVWNLSQQGLFFGPHIKQSTVEEFAAEHPR